MKHAQRFSLRSIFFVALVFSGVSSGAAQTPEVLKVEPPGWWTGHSINPVRVLIRGRNFLGAKVRVGGAGISSGDVKINQAGTYLFVDVRVARQAGAGKRP